MTAPRRVIFLDIDGVLNSAPFLGEGADLPWEAMIDPRAVARLNALVRATGAAIVVSSSWRCHVPLARIARILGDHGFDGEIIGATPRRPSSRGAEIQAWLDEAADGPDAFVILDDVSDMGPLTPHLVLTSFDEGLLDAHVADAAARLCRTR